MCKRNRDKKTRLKEPSSRRSVQSIKPSLVKLKVYARGNSLFHQYIKSFICSEDIEFISDLNFESCKNLEYLELPSTLVECEDINFIYSVNTFVNKSDTPITLHINYGLGEQDVNGQYISYDKYWKSASTGEIITELVNDTAVAYYPIKYISAPNEYRIKVGESKQIDIKIIPSVTTETGITNILSDGPFY